MGNFATNLRTRFEADCRARCGVVAAYRQHVTMLRDHCANLLVNAAEHFEPSLTIPCCFAPRKQVSDGMHLRVRRAHAVPFEAHGLSVIGRRVRHSIATATTLRSSTTSARFYIQGPPASARSRSRSHSFGRQRIRLARSARSKAALPWHCPPPVAAPQLEASPARPTEHHCRPGEPAVSRSHLR